MPRPCHADHAISPSTCRFCELVCRSSWHRQQWGEPVPDPGIWQAAKNLAVAVVKDVAAGRPRASADVVALRLAHCNACPHLIMPDRRCQKCGCPVSKKAMWLKEECPLGKWDKARAPYFLPGLLDPIQEEEAPTRPPDWARRSDVVARHAAGLAQVLGLDVGQPRDADGDGVVICGGGKYWTGAALCARMIRRHGCRLPIQIWHRGSSEPVIPSDVEGLGVELVDWERRDLGYVPRIGRGWEQKLIALTGCGFRRVLYLDADAYPVGDVTPLFEVLDQVAVAYWSDLPDTDRKVTWSAYGLSPDNRPPTVQGGHVLYDRVEGWRMLAVAHWLCQHSDWSFAHGYGDQDQVRVALHATGAASRHLGAARWVHPHFECAHEGKTLIVHRCRGKLWAPWHGDAPRWIPSIPGESAVMEEYAALTRGTAAQVFSRIYRVGAWGPPGASSGGGREADEKSYLKCVQRLLDLAHAEVVVDLGAGDQVVTRQLQAPTIYAVEVASPDSPAMLGSAPAVQFLDLDLDKDRGRLPAGDVALMRDVLHHWPADLVADWLAWAAEKGPWRWLIVTFDARGDKSADIPLGGYRPLPFDKPPIARAGLYRVVQLGNKDVCLLRCAAP